VGAFENTRSPRAGWASAMDGWAIPSTMAWGMGMGHPRGWSGGRGGRSLIGHRGRQRSGNVAPAWRLRGICQHGTGQRGARGWRAELLPGAGRGVRGDTACDALARLEVRDVITTIGLGNVRGEFLLGIVRRMSTLDACMPHHNQCSSNSYAKGGLEFCVDWVNAFIT
jgi:hypothetical protein